ncbi:MAG TPA: hypothetical protein VGE94_06900, partial [Chloroflexota bacterium]
MKRNNRWLIALPIVSALTLVACTAKPPATSKTDHAQVEKVDANLKKVVLSAEAARRLDIKTAPVRDENVARSRIVGGQIVAVAASSITVAATAPAAPSLTPVNAADQFATVLDEPFAANSRGWPDKSASTAWFDPDGLGYRLTGVTPSHFVAVGVPGQTNLPDVMISATFRKTAGPAGAGFGLIVRDQQPASRDGL